MTLRTCRFHCIIEKKGMKWCQRSPFESAACFLDDPAAAISLPSPWRCRYVEDQGSTNGVYVDDVKVKAATELKEGTIVCFGALEYRYLFK